MICILSLLILGCGSESKEDNNKKSRTISAKTTKSKENYRKPISWGKKDIIYIFADKKIWDYGRNKIKQSFEREFFTTRNEKLFNIEKVEIKEIQHYYKFTNLIFFADITTDEPVANYVKQLLGEEIINNIESTDPNIFVQEDLWARGQLVIFLLGRGTKETLLYTFGKLNFLFEQFKANEMRRLENLAYRMGLNKKEMNYQKEHYQWQIELPKYFNVFRRDDENNFVSYLLRVEKYPDRYLSVYWENMPENNVSKKWLFEKRKELSWQYYDEDEFSKQDVVQENTTFNEYKGYKLHGKWQNKKYYIGGAFASFAFYEPKQKRAYIIDTSVYFPEGNKLRALLELEIIATKFKAISQELQ